MALRDAHGGFGQGPKILSRAEADAAVAKAVNDLNLSAPGARVPDAAPAATPPRIDRASIPPAAEAGTASVPPSATETATNRPSTPSPDHIQKAFDRVKSLREKSELVTPGVAQTEKALKQLAQERKQAERTLADTLDQAGNKREAALLRMEMSPLQPASIKLQFNRWAAGETATAFEAIEALTKPGRESVEDLKSAPVNVANRAKQGVQEVASTWYGRAKFAGKALLGVGVVNTFGLPATMTAAGALAAGIGMEALYRTYQKRKNGVEIKGILPKAQGLAEGLNRLIDNPSKVIGESLADVAEGMQGLSDRLQGKRTERVVDMAEAQGKPEVAAAVQNLDAERISLVTTLAPPSVEALAAAVRASRPPEVLAAAPTIPQEADTIQPVGVSEPLAATIGLDGDVHVPEVGGTTVSVPVAEIFQKMGVDMPNTATTAPGYADDNFYMPEISSKPVVIAERAIERDRNRSLRALASGDVETVYTILPTMLKQKNFVDGLYPNTDPDVESLGERLDGIAQQALLLAAEAKNLKGMTTLMSSEAPETQESLLEFKRQAGDEADYQTFDPEAWAVNQLVSMGEASGGQEGILQGLVNADGEKAVNDPRVQGMLKSLIYTVVTAQTGLRDIEAANNQAA